MIDTKIRIKELRKPELKDEMVLVSYWSCGFPACRHNSKVSAVKCIAKRDLAEKRIVRHKWSRSDLTEMLAQFRAGTTKAAIARKLGLCANRIAQLIAKAERMENHLAVSNPFDGLSFRVRNCLYAKNIYNVDEVQAAFVHGELAKIPNLGIVGLNEIYVWLLAMR